MKIFGVSIITILLLVAAYFAGSRGLVGKATKVVTG